jgi:hypothetical protein
MEDLCPGYGKQWRRGELFYLWLWREALTQGGEECLLEELWRDVIGFMFWIVRRRYHQLLLAQRAERHEGAMLEKEWDHHYRATPPHDLCVAFPHRRGMRDFIQSLWQCRVIRVVQGSVVGETHETLTLRLCDEDLRLIVHVDPAFRLRPRLWFVVLVLFDDEIYCQYSHFSGTEPFPQEWRFPLMQLS